MNLAATMQRFAWRMVLLSVQFAAYYQSIEILAPERFRSAGTMEAAWVPSLLVALPVLATLATMLRSRVRLLSDVLPWLLASFLVVPSLALAVRANGDLSTVAWKAFGMTAVGFLTFRLLLSARPKARRTEPPRTSFGSLAVMLSGSLIIALAVLVFFYGQSGFNLGLDDIYDRREGATSRFTSGPTLAYYFLSWNSRIVAPAVFALALWDRRWFAIWPLALMFEVLYFSFTGARDTLFLALLALIVSWAIRLGRHRAEVPYLGILLTVILAAPIAIYYLVNNDFWIVSFPRRLGQVPAAIAANYVEFTDTVGATGFQHNLGVLLQLVDLPLAIPRQVGVFLGQESNHANGSFWADGYVSAGIVGVIAVTVVAAALVVATDHRTFADKAGTYEPAVVASAACVTFALVNTGLVQTVVTEGWLVLLLLAPYLRRPSSAPEARPSVRMPPDPAQSPTASPWPSRSLARAGSRTSQPDASGTHNHDRSSS